MEDEPEKLSFKFSYIQCLVFLESLGSLLLQKGTWGAASLKLYLGGGGVHFQGAGPCLPVLSSKALRQPNSL